MEKTKKGGRRKGWGKIGDRQKPEAIQKQRKRERERERDASQMLIENEVSFKVESSTDNN